MVTRFFTMEQFHNKHNVGSTKLRVHNLLKHWPEAGLYRYGDKADVMIFQKVYCTYDYKLPNHYPGIRILDVCDVDWNANPDIYIKETIDNVHAVVVPTEQLRKLIAQMTDTPVHVIPDRFDLEQMPPRKRHKGRLKRAVWFGYAHNAELLKFAVSSLEKRGIELLVVSNEDPGAYRWADDPAAFLSKYKFVKWDENAHTNIQMADVAVLPKGYRPEDRYKSENRTVLAQLLGLPVVQDADELEAMMDAKARNHIIDDIYEELLVKYNCKESVADYRELIKTLQNDKQSS